MKTGFRTTLPKIHLTFVEFWKPPPSICIGPIFLSLDYHFQYWDHSMVQPCLSCKNKSQN